MKETKLLGCLFFFLNKNRKLAGLSPFVIGTDLRVEEKARSCRMVPSPVIPRSQILSCLELELLPVTHKEIEKAKVFCKHVGPV